MIEKAVSIQLLDHTNSHNLCENLQLAYRCHHSTETALIKIMNDLLFEAIGDTRGIFRLIGLI